MMMTMILVDGLDGWCHFAENNRETGVGLGVVLPGSAIICKLVTSARASTG